MTTATKTPKPGSSTTQGIKAGLGLPGVRDAFHFPAVLVCSKEKVLPGQSVGFVARTNYCEVRPHPLNRRWAIVDPFLPMDFYISEATLFWVFLVPEAVSAVRHHFTIKGEDSPFPEALPEKFLEDMAKEGLINEVNTKPLESYGINSDECRGCN